MHKNITMAQTNIIGRENEMRELENCLKSDRSELAIVFGRRRVGKTFLVDQFFDGKYDFTFVGGHKVAQKIQLRNFAKTIKEVTHEKTLRKFTDWYDAFDSLEEYLGSLPADRKKVVFIDEMPWIDGQRSTFVSAFENFWNSWAARRNDIVFIASGSASSWMVDKLVENPGGLHARITKQIYLRPFTLHETETYLRSRGCTWDRYQIMQCYMFFGGIPFYLSLINPKLSIDQNVDLLCFKKGGALRLEFEELYNALFVNADNYISVVKLLAEHRQGLTLSELKKGTKFDGQNLAKILRNLERSDFIMKFKYYGKKAQDCLYKLTDFYTLFYYKYIEPNKDLYDANWWSHNSGSRSIEIWQGISFELVCLLHIDQIRHALGISGVATEVSAWFNKADKASETRGSQIDLVIERADRTIHLCEMKFSKNAYSLTSEYSDKLRARMGLFKEGTKITKTLVNTFVTTYGVSNANDFSIVHSEVTMEDLFKL